MGRPRDLDALRYYRVATQRLAEAKVIFDVDLYAASMYIAGYAVECMLKALLIHVTPASQRPPSGKPTIEWLKRDFGHDLDKLRRGLAARGAIMPRDVARQFVFVATWDPEDRYDPGPGKPDDAERFIDAAEEVVRWAENRM